MALDIWQDIREHSLLFYPWKSWLMFEMFETEEA